MSDALARVEALLARVDEECRSVDRVLEEEDRRRAEAARSGALGPHWQAVQRRIDGGRTTLEGVFDGSDTSPEAAELRGSARQRAAEVPEPSPEQVESLDRALAEVEATRARIAQALDVVAERDGDAPSGPTTSPAWHR